MKPEREYVDSLRDILDAAEKAERCIEGLNFRTFAADDKAVLA